MSNKEKSPDENNNNKKRQMQTADYFQRELKKICMA